MPRRVTSRRHARRKDSVDAVLVSSKWMNLVVVTILTVDSVVALRLTFVWRGPKTSSATAANGGVFGFPRKANKIPISCHSSLSSPSSSKFFRDVVDTIDGGLPQVFVDDFTSSSLVISTHTILSLSWIFSWWQAV